MKTVVVFSCFYEPYISGAERFVKEMVERLSSDYHFVVITSKLDKRLLKREIKILPLQSRGMESQKNYPSTGPENNFLEIRRIGIGHELDKWLYPVLAPFYALRYKPNLIHAVMESYAGIALWLLKVIERAAPDRFYPFKTVLTLQSGDLDDKRRKAKIPKWLWRKIHTAPDFVTAISSYLAERAKKLGVPESKITIIPNGVNIDAVDIECRHSLSTENLKQTKIPYRIICVGRLSWEKGIEYLIRAMTVVHREFPETRLILVGDGNERKRLQILCRKLGIDEFVEFKGSLSHCQVIEELRRSHVFCCPSLAEGLGIAFIEAQAAGVPVIGTRVGGIPEIIEDGKTGLLVPPKDPEAIAKAISKLFKDKNLAQSLAHNARKSVKKFDWQIISSQISEIYKKLLV